MYNLMKWREGFSANRITNENHDPICDVKIIYSRNSNHDERRYNIATCNKGAVVFVADNGKPPIERDAAAFLKDTDKFQTVNILSKHVDEMDYLLTLLCGRFGWSPYLKLMDEGHKKYQRIAIL